jgi:hypothetical protein
MENIGKNNQEIEDVLLSELKDFNVKINIAKVFIVLLMIIIPSVLILKILGLISGLITFLSIISLLIGLVFSLRMYNHTKILYKTHIWLLDGILNEKPLNR